MENIMKLFNSEDKDELKHAFKEIIKEQFKTQIEDMDLYLFDPNVIEKLIEESFSEIIKDVKLEFKKNLKEKLLDSVDFSKLVKKITK